MIGTVLDILPEARLAKVAQSGIGTLDDNYIHTAFSVEPLEIGRSYSFVPEHGFSDEIPYQLVYKGE